MPAKQYDISERLKIRNQHNQQRTARVVAAELREVDRTGRKDWCYILEDVQDRSRSSVRQRDLLLDN